MRGNKNVHWRYYIWCLDDGYQSSSKLRVLPFLNRELTYFCSALASEEQLTRFSEILLKIPIHVEESAISTMGLQATTLWIQTLRSADLWELSNLRSQFQVSHEE